MEAPKDTQASYQGTAMGSWVGGPPNLIHSSVGGDSSQTRRVCTQLSKM